MRWRVLTHDPLSVTNMHEVCERGGKDLFLHQQVEPDVWIKALTPLAAVLKSQLLSITLSFYVLGHVSERVPLARGG